MVSSKAATVTEYLEQLDDDRRSELLTVRNVIKKKLPKGYEEGMLYGMIAWYVPLSRYPNTYNGQPIGVAALAAQKNYNAVYLHSVYGDPKIAATFAAEYAKTGKKLDMGKSCVRFKKAADLALDMIGKAVASTTPEELIAHHDAVHGAKKAKAPRAPAAKKVAAKKAPAKKKAAPAKKKSPAKKR